MQNNCSKNVEDGCLENFCENIFLKSGDTIDKNYMKITDDSVIGIISQLKIREEDKDSIKNCSENERNKILDESSEGIWDSNSKNHEIVDEDPQDV